MPRPTSETGSRLSGNISYVWSPRDISCRVFLILVSVRLGGSVPPDTPDCRTPEEKTGPIDSGNWNATVWKYQLRAVAPCH